MNGINNLIDNNFIAESIVPNEFYINPDYVFNGDRLALIKLYEIENKNTKIFSSVESSLEESAEEKKEELRRLEEKIDKNGNRFEEPELFASASTSAQD